MVSVRVSEASRNDARGISRGDLDTAIARVENERKSHVARKLQIQARLAVITGIVKGKRVDRQTYGDLCSEQGELKGEILRIDREMSRLNTELSSLRRDQLNHPVGEGAAYPNIERMLRLILVEIEELRRDIKRIEEDK